MSSRPLWILGAGGLLGASIVRAASQFDRWSGHSIGWSAPDAADQVRSAAAEFLSFAGGRDWTVIWTAGAGVIGTSEQQLAAETSLLEAVLDELSAGDGGEFFLASSAGGVYAGSTDLPITEESAVAPLSPYGENKLRQEALVRLWTEQTGHRAVIGRIANLYGPGQALDKQQGLISQVCLATVRRRPISVYVSLDTLRDYVFAPDCADAILDAICAARSGSDRCIVKILCSGQTTSIGGVLAESRRVLGRRAPVVLGASPNRKMQGSALCFRSLVLTSVDKRSWTPLPAGIEAVAAGIRARVGIGL